MKWVNKGHELDIIAEKVLSTKSIYLFGASNSGRIMLEKYAAKIQIKGFIDNDESKKVGFLGLSVITPKELKLDADEAIVIEIQGWTI
jgi:hypothetical protein